MAIENQHNMTSKYLVRAIFEFAHKKLCIKKVYKSKILAQLHFHYTEKIKHIAVTQLQQKKTIRTQNNEGVES